MRVFGIAANVNPSPLRLKFDATALQALLTNGAFLPDPAAHGTAHRVYG